MTDEEKKEAQKARQRACSAAWYKANRDKQRASAAKWNKANRDRKRASEAKWWKANPGKRRAYRGLPEPLRPCPPTCENCGNLPGKRSLALDHRHTTGEFRGWLCLACNTGIGKLGDNIEGLERAIAYLRRAEGSG